MRKLYGSWACQLTQDQIKAGTKPEDIKVPCDVPTCKKNLFVWLSQTVDEMNKDKARVVHCWESTELLRAWERAVQVEASTKVAALFPNIDVNDISIDVSDSPDEEAGAVGVPFTEVEHEEEWEGWLDWSAVDTQTTGGGASTDV
jgi:molybdopterin-guanine dinucleotide biosynthesis protein A